MVNLESVIATAAQMGATQALVTLGLTSGELSQRDALKTYGKWMAQAIEQRRLNPCRVGDGRNGTKWYKVTDILALKAYDQARAELIIKTL